MLIIKKCFQFLNSFLEFGYYQSVLPLGFGKQIGGAIVILNPIVMMHLPTFGHGLSVCLFPYKYMLKNIACFRCSGMFGFINQYITLIMFSATTLPVITGSSLHCFISTGSTQLGIFPLEPATMRARLLCFKPPFTLLFKAVFSSLDAVLSEIFFSIHTLYYNIYLNNIQALALDYFDEGTRFDNIKESWEA